jgi:hypothetical protein
LRIEIDHQNPLADSSERSPQIYGRGCLANPALLIGDRQNSKSVATDA